ncbi:MAG: recombinase family protein [Nigerium sp.]|nr:recombinase family protein [Nigerium sp.]
MGVLGYTRVSAGSPDADAQLDALMCAEVSVQDVFTDHDTAEKGAPGLPAMRRLLANAEEGATVVVWRLDRLGRSLSEVLDTVSLIRERGINLRSLQEGIDSRTDTGRLLLDFTARLHEYERHLSSERIAAGMASSRKTGTRLGRPPLDPSEIRDKIRAVEDARARGVTAADAAQLVGWSRATFYRHQQEHGSQR